MPSSPAIEVLVLINTLILLGWSALFFVVGVRRFKRR